MFVVEGHFSTKAVIFFLPDFYLWLLERSWTCTAIWLFAKVDLITTNFKNLLYVVNWDFTICRRHQKRSENGFILLIKSTDNISGPINAMVKSYKNSNNSDSSIKIYNYENWKYQIQIFDTIDIIFTQKAIKWGKCRNLSLLTSMI